MSETIQRARCVCVPYGILCPECSKIATGRFGDGRIAELICTNTECRLFGKKMKAHLPTVEIEIED